MALCRRAPAARAFTMCPCWREQGIIVADAVVRPQLIEVGVVTQEHLPGNHGLASRGRPPYSSSKRAQRTAAVLHWPHPQPMAGFKRRHVGSLLRLLVQILDCVRDALIWGCVASSCIFGCQRHPGANQLWQPIQVWAGFSSLPQKALLLLCQELLATEARVSLK